MTPFVLILAGCPGVVEKPLEDQLVYLSDENNYTYSAAIDMGHIETASGVDVTVTWDQLQHDIQGHDVTSCDDVDQLNLVWFQFTEEADLEQLIVCDDIPQSDASPFLQDPPEPEPSDCKASLSELSVVGNPFPYEEYYVEAEGGLWLTRVTGPAGTLMLARLMPSEASKATEVDLTDTSSSLTFEADITSITMPETPSEALSWVFDWSLLENGANSQGCDPTLTANIDQFWLARYDGMSPTDLQGAFLDLQIIADEIWTVDAGARTSVNLNELTTLDGGGPPTALDPSATWVLALRSTFAANPAPVFLTVLNVTE